jgi:hypothetical protein
MTFTRDELESAFLRYAEQVEAISSAGEWERFADLFTEDAEYEEHLYGTFRGRDEIRRWIVTTMTTPPGSWMPTFPASWYVVDEERGRIVCEILNRLRDPGDGSVHEPTNITILTYAGDGLFSREEDVYNPARFTSALTAWARVANEHGTLADDELAWLDAALPRWRADTA